MRPASVRNSLFAFLVALPALTTAARSAELRVGGAAQEPGVVLALDSSRSLTVEQSRAASELASELVTRLAAIAPPSVLTFDDGVHWLARSGEQGTEEARAALEAVRPTGHFTVLDDGLVEGVRSLANGGVAVLISDGKDENSATTVEDVARLARESGVRVVTVGAGQFDERILRRLALLTGGDYAGAVTGADPGALAAKVEALRSQVAQVAAERTPPPAPPAPVAAPAPPVPAAAPAPTRDNSRLLLLVGALVAAAGVVLGFLLARRRSAPEPESLYEPDAGTKPGVPVPEPPAAPAPAPPAESEPKPAPIDAAHLARLRARPQIPAGGLFEVSLDDTAAFQRLPFAESIERTLVITEEVVLSVREPGKEARTYRLPSGRAVDIGRDAKRNTLAFADPTMSTQHARVVLDEGEVFLLDLGSTNGVLYQGRRVDSAQLQPGEKFRAGMIEFELLLHRASMV